MMPICLCVCPIPLLLIKQQNTKRKIHEYDIFAMSPTPVP